MKFIAILLFAAYAVFAQTFTDSRDGQVYRIVKIGSRIWMGENLNYKVNGSYCYNDNSENCKTYGRLYTWEAAANACPEGFHLPSKDEWNLLLKSIGDRDEAGLLLKSNNGWDYQGNGSNNYKFSVLPAGYGDSEDFSDIGVSASFWSTYVSSKTHAHNLRFNANNTYALWGRSSIKYSYSVRCIKDTY